MRNKPNFGQLGWHLGVDCAKRSQFGPAWPGPRRRKDAKQTQFVTPEGRLCKTNPIRRWPTGPTVQNEANWGGRPGPRRANRAKRTQFPPGQDAPIIYSTIPVRCRLCETNPIPAGPGGMGASEARGERAERSQFRLCRRNGMHLFAFFSPRQVVGCVDRLRRRCRRASLRRASVPARLSSIGASAHESGITGGMPVRPSRAGTHDLRRASSAAAGRQDGYSHIHGWS